VLAPLAIVWMVVALRDAPEATPEPTPEPAPAPAATPAVAPEAVAADASSSA
jgi:hypothetical protein